ncbi:hypothetical protein AOQ84DRAFT_227900 [Glonium stellatum]|uniref:Uncharacterized protein n=1 Tax=Glonium stellatum TaxID=574774 RepID=A0A8E2JX11_9PEZI|nr:hypothetical protein AOQ84DRAFT_227900 [Glonium stellatum]
MPDWVKRHGEKIRVTASALLFRRFGSQDAPPTSSLGLLGPLYAPPPTKRRGPPDLAATPPSKARLQPCTMHPSSSASKRCIQQCIQPSFQRRFLRPPSTTGIHSTEHCQRLRPTNSLSSARVATIAHTALQSFAPPKSRDRRAASAPPAIASVPRLAQHPREANLVPHQQPIRPASPSLPPWSVSHFKHLGAWRDILRQGMTVELC